MSATKFVQNDMWPVFLFHRVEVPSYAFENDPVFSRFPTSNSAANQSGRSSPSSAACPPSQNGASSPHGSGDDDQSDTSNDSHEQPALEIAPSSSRDAEAERIVARLRGSGHDAMASAHLSGQAVAVESVPAAMMAGPHGAVATWGEDDEGDDGEEDDEEEDEDVDVDIEGEGEEGDVADKYQQFQVVSRSPSPHPEPSAAADETLSASMFRPWSEENGGAAIMAPFPPPVLHDGGEGAPKFLTWTEMVAAHHPHNLPLLLPRDDSTGASVETVGPAFVEWKPASNPPSPSKPDVKDSSIQPAPSTAEASRSDASLGAMEGAARDDEDERADLEGDADSALENSSSSQDEGGGDASGLAAGEGQAAEALPSLPGWMQSLKPRKPHSTAKKRRRMTPKS